MALLGCLFLQQGLRSIERIQHARKISTSSALELMIVLFSKKTINPAYFATIPCFKICPKSYISSKELYNGTGANRITLGSRQSVITPFFIR